MYCSKSAKENGESNPFRSRNNLLTAIFFRMCYSNGADNFMGYRQNPSKLIEVGITF